MPNNSGLYNPNLGHDACGVGFVAKIDGSASHELVLQAAEALHNMAHRGGSGCGLPNPDGAGIMFAMPKAFMQKVWKDSLSENFGPSHAVGQLFMPRDESLKEKICGIFKSVLAAHGLACLGFRDVSVDGTQIESEDIRKNMPRFMQVLAKNTQDEESRDFERRLYVARRAVEHCLSEDGGIPKNSAHIVSFSSRTVIYKGLIHGGKLAKFYKDLLDPDFMCHFAIFHERFSTNTTPAWHLAQPFRMLAHNGEINTLNSNLANVKMKEAMLDSPLFGDNIKYLKPVVSSAGSDSACLDAVFELLYQGGRSLCHTAMMLVPEPFGAHFIMGQGKRAFYEYHASLMEAWDGPAALVFTNGNQIGAALDRNALRPCRYTITKDGLIVLASESGVIDISPEKILKRGRLRPRKMLVVDFDQHRIITDTECKNAVVYAKPYNRWIKEKGISLQDLALPQQDINHVPENLLREQYLFGMSADETETILKPMMNNAQEPVVSMGIDTPLAVLSQRPQLLFNYLKQRFAQVTNPPIDPLRESLVMSLTGFLGKRGNILEETADHYSLLRLSNPILTHEDLLKIRYAEQEAVKSASLDMLFDIKEIKDKKNPDPAVCRGLLEQGITRLLEQAEKALEQNARILILTDRNADKDHAAIPSLLAVSALHQHLLKKDLRHLCSIAADTGEARDVMQTAQLLAFGASAVHPRLALETIYSLTLKQKFQSETQRAEQIRKNITNYIIAQQKGLMKTCSRMGISVLRSFAGGQLFEAVGFSENLVNKYFCGLPSKIGGIDLEHIALDSLHRHQKAFSLDSSVTEPEVYGLYKTRKNGEKHLWSPKAISSLHKAVRENDYAAFKEYAKESDFCETPVTLRSLFNLKANPIPLEEVEPAEKILSRFIGAAMSFGSISKEAHEAIAIAFNRIGGRSNCGEGGEKKERGIVRANGDCAKSKIRQIASGRFGVTAEYLCDAEEIQIKLAQGAKPGEGGQLPAHKVLPQIAEVRHTIAGVTLISPPPHHDIYSIEDLAQLIYDLKRLNKNARVSVKLVSGTNVGTIASGVAKAGADSIVISGHDGGTGASPRSSISYVGLPWEIGLAETHQALLCNSLRNRVTLQTDGQLRTGKDLAIAAILGAEEFAFGTGLLVALGCCLLRVCHLGTCTVGIATQDPKLCEKFKGNADHVERYLRFLAEDFREQLASMGVRSVDGLIGRTDLIGIDRTKFTDSQSSLFENGFALWQDKISRLDFGPLLEKMPYTPAKCTDKPDIFKDNALEKAMNAQILEELKNKNIAHFEGSIRNTDRTAGARLTGELLAAYGDSLSSRCVSISLKGSAGQSFGAFLTKETILKLKGDANDYVGKGLSGGVIAISPYSENDDLFADQTAIGNVALYGATNGELYVAGSAGERFAVRNSGADAVVEGVGDHACEYMTGGTVVILGATGYNFGAGMSGGTAYVYDRSEIFSTLCNMETLDIESIWQSEDIKKLRRLLENHVRHTGSALAKFILDNWQTQIAFFLKVIPLEYKKALQRGKNMENHKAESVAGTEEVYPENGQADSK